MKISDPSATRLCDEHVILKELLPLGGAHVLDLGCGTAEKTRAIARDGQVASITALEVDEVQHGKNLQSGDQANVVFRLGGAEAIPAADASFDIVLMFKSLHHVPVDRMDRALSEIRRVLKPGGLAYLSEPIFAGDYNDVLRLFHDEQAVREAAFAAIRRAVDGGGLTLVSQTFFDPGRHFDDFAQFEKQVLQVTHTRAPAVGRDVRGGSRRVHASHDAGRRRLQQSDAGRPVVQRRADAISAARARPSAASRPRRAGSRTSLPSSSE